MQKIRIGIIGGAGYTAGELIRILLNHPEAEIRFIHSISHSGEPVTSVHDDLLGETPLLFSDDMDLPETDVLFLCQGHGKSRSFLDNHPLPDSVKVIDLSADFRLNDGSHNFVYGLPELNREAIRHARRIANPGCFATGIELALLPWRVPDCFPMTFTYKQLPDRQGPGSCLQKPPISAGGRNLSAYKIFSHQHQEEILQSIRQLQPAFDWEFNFIPVRGNHTRGIFVTAYTRFGGSAGDARELFTNWYCDHPFSVVTSENPSLKQVINTNKALIYIEKQNNKLVIVTCIDNLLKGASGQAVQNMNLMSGLEETTGLKLKPSAF